MPTEEGFHQTWYVDSSVILRALLGDSPAARAWFTQAWANHDRFVGSRLTEVEVYRTIAKAGQHPSQARPYLGKFTLLLIDPVVDDAIALQQRLAAGDAIHIATAQTLGPKTVAIVTHDLQMAKAATQIGFTVVDPVTDDPGCTPVA